MAETLQHNLRAVGNAPEKQTSKLRIEFLTEDDPLYILPFFEEFLRDYGDEFDILQVSCSPVMGNRSRKKMVKELSALYGVFGFSRLATRVATARVLGLLPRSRRAHRFYTMAQLCKAHGVPFRRIGNPNASEFVEEVQARAPEVIASVACPYILKDKLLSLPKLGCVNIHHAPLPRYKGMMPSFWQLFHGETKVGVTVHYMVAKIDEGDALLQSELEVKPGSTLDEVIRASKQHGAHCMAKVLRQIKANEQKPVPLDLSKGTYFKFPTLDEINEFRRRGLRGI